MKGIVYSALSVFMLIALLPSRVSAMTYGPEIDRIYMKVIQGLNAQYINMRLGYVDVLTQRTRPDDIWGFDASGFLITETIGFHICFIGFNIRADQSYRRGGITFWPLADVNFRHALAHSINKDCMRPNWVMRADDSMVPESLGGWWNPDVNPHKFKLGNPFTSRPYEHSTCGILKSAGYTFIDTDRNFAVTDADYWRMPDGNPLPRMDVFSTTLLAEPQKYTMVAAWIQDCKEVGLAGTAQNGNSGVVHFPAAFGWYAPLAYSANFDIFIADFKLDRFPDYLYDWFHSSQDSLLHPSAYNAFGVNDPDLDTLLETLKFSVDHTTRLQACYDTQAWLADPGNLLGLPVIPVYSMNYYDVFSNEGFSYGGLRGIVLSPGFGADNIWTDLSIHWDPGREKIAGDGKTYMELCLSDFPGLLNPLSACSPSAWKILDRVYDPLLSVNPYDHSDMPWLAQSWEVVQTPTGINATFYLRNDVYWQDGYPYTASDAKFSLDFMRDWQIPKYKPAWEHIEGVTLINPTTFTVQADVESQSLLYSWATLAAMLPPQVWNQPWASQAAILAFAPAAMPYGVALGYTPGPTPPPTNLFGTGPCIFKLFDLVGGYAELNANRNYFRTPTEIDNLLMEMFHDIGDVDRDGRVDVVDLVLICHSWGSVPGEPHWDPDADLNQDGVVDLEDLHRVGCSFSKLREYP